MHILSASTLTAIVFMVAAPSMASTRFTCPAEADFLAQWNETLLSAQAIDLKQDLVAQAQQEAYLKIFSHGIPNEDLLVNQFTLNDATYTLVATKDDFVWDPDYLDAYGVVFAQGQSEPIAVIKSDTDRGDWSCEALVFPDRIVVPAAEFDKVTIDSPQDVPVAIDGVRYEHMYVVSAQMAFASNAQGDIVTFIRGQ